MNKKADERLLSIYLFIIYIIVSIGVISGVLVFYGAGLDIREIEADILSEKIIDCLVDEGELVDEVLEDDFSLQEFCRIELNDNTKTYVGEEQIGIEVKIFDFNSCFKDEEKRINCADNLREKIEIGRKDLFGFCGLEGKKLSKCSEKYIYVLHNENKIMLKVLGVVRRIEKNN